MRIKFKKIRNMSIGDLKRDLMKSNSSKANVTGKQCFVCKSNNVENIRVYVNGHNNQIIVHKGCCLKECAFYIEGDNNFIEIFEDCTLKGTWFVMADNNNHIHIGERTTVSGDFWGYTTFHCLEGTSIIVNEDCMFSGNVIVRTTDGHPILDFTTRRTNSSTSNPQITIGRHSWIGMNSIILKGVKLGKNVIVGANSVVTQSFKDTCKYNDSYIISGNPAKKIKDIGTWARDRHESQHDMSLNALYYANGCCSKRN